MAKGVSSASTSTRKKHSRKAALAKGIVDEPQPPNEKKQKKGKKNKEPRKKEYIPPVKPAPARPDPLDVLGIAQRIPADLLIVFRKLAKKDSITKRRALEDLQADWVEKARRDEWLLEPIVETLPVWIHHLPSLFLHPSRKIRSLAVVLHTSLLNLPSPVPEQLFASLRDVTDADHAEYVVGAWCMAAYDVDRQVAVQARQSWARFTLVSNSVSHEGKQSKRLQLSAETTIKLWEFMHRVLLDPAGVYMYVNPPQPTAPPPPQRKGGAKGLARNAPSALKEDNGQARGKVDEEEEDETDRNARLRIGGFGTAEWVLNACVQIDREPNKVENMLKPLENPVLWSALYHGQSAPFIQDELEAFGWNQPGVRRAAWSFLSVVLRTCKDHLQPLLQTLSAATLRSAWTEPDTIVRGAMWQPLVMFLRDHQTSWQLASAVREDANDEDEDDSGSDELDDQPKASKSTEINVQFKVFPAYQEFLQFLELGCMGSPITGYPAILIILSTIPSPVLASEPSPLHTLFTSFWAAVDGRALSGLDRLPASAAFLSSLLECSVYIARRLLREDGELLLSDDESDTRMTARALVREQITKAWEELSTQRLKVSEKAAAGSFVSTLESMVKVDEELADGTWDALASAIRQQLIIVDRPLPTLVSTVLGVFQTTFSPESRLAQANQTLIEEVIHSIISQLERALDEPDSATIQPARLASFVSVLDTFRHELFADAELASAIDQTCVRHTHSMLTLSPEILLVYLTRRNDTEKLASLWNKILQEISGHGTLDTITPLLDAAAKGTLPDVLRPSADELEDTLGQLLASALRSTADSKDYVLLKRVLQHPDPFVSRTCFVNLVTSICSAFSQHVQDCLHNVTESLPSLNRLTSLLQVVLKKDVLPLLPTEVSLTLLPDIFTYAYVAPRMDDSKETADEQVAVDLWSQTMDGVSQDIRENTQAIVKQRLSDMLADCSIRIRSDQVLEIATRTLPHLAIDVVEDLAPAPHELDGMLDNLPAHPAHVSLGVLDPLVFAGEWSDSDDTRQYEYDHLGYSAYARVVISLLLHFRDHRDLAKQNIWALRHFYSLAIYAQDLLAVPSASSPAFINAVQPSSLKDLVQKVDQLAAYLLSETLDDGWLSQVASSITQGKTNTRSHAIETLLLALTRPAKAGDGFREARVLRHVLQHLFASASKADAEQFLLLARGIEKTAPHASHAILLSVTQFAPEPQRLDRLRNELAANMLGIPSSKANNEGLWTLRRLAAIAPDPESDIVYLPTPRAVNLMKACQQWITSNDDLDEEVECEMTSVFLNLAPILQNMPGSHWELIYDVLENNLENCSFKDLSTLPLLSRSLKLLIAIQDLVSTNKTLRAGWDDRKIAILTLVRDLVAQKSEIISNTPLSICRELALTIVQDLPQSLIGNDTLSKMCHLVTDVSETVPQMAYKMLRNAANKRTEYLVLEASLDTEEEIVPLDLPAELVLLLQSTLPDEDFHEERHNSLLFGYLLTWMLTFDLFTNASLKVKSGYMDHLRRTNLIEGHFLPQIFTILDLYDGASHAVKLNNWEVDEYYLEFYSPETPISLQLLGAHLYYRALLLVPSLIRTWLLDCRDRQLSGTVMTYTSTYFSPAIIRAELAQVKDPVLAGDLGDETFTVKVAAAVHEITASYAVDEYALELKLKIPADWPLHTIVTKDSSRVGVSEDRWRSWILGVQQILTFRSGSIIDGLAFFKKNVTSHFEGLSECAICYSVISAMDSSLPKKPCKTCKNRFHAGCLYKWFNSSHSSSCPLCRSEIIQ